MTRNENTGSQTNRRFRIAHLIISNAWGGAENVACNIARHLEQNGGISNIGEV